MRTHAHEAAAAVLVREYEQALLQEGCSILEIDETVAVQRQGKSGW
jgi:hypothetical protein